MFNKKEEYPRVYIEWNDAAGDDGAWRDKEEIESMAPVKCKTAGFVLEETKEYVTVCQSINEHQVMGRLTIPKSIITKRK